MYFSSSNSQGSYVRAHLLSMHLFCRQQFPGKHQREETNHGGLIESRAHSTRSSNVSNSKDSQPHVLYASEVEECILKNLTNVHRLSKES